MVIIYTKHAKEMLILRNIKENLVEGCINNPDEIISAREGKKIYLKDFGKNYLKVILSERGEDKIIITLYWLAERRMKE